jgi:hypothetical protein
VLVQRHQWLVQAEVIEQTRGHARVFAGHGIDDAEHLHRAQRQVGQVSDRCGHDIQRACRILLRPGRRSSGLGDDRRQGHV